MPCNRNGCFPAVSGRSPTLNPEPRNRQVYVVKAISTAADALDDDICACSEDGGGALETLLLPAHWDGVSQG